jgi:TctA family transporter
MLIVFIMINVMLNVIMSNVPMLGQICSVSLFWPLGFYFYAQCSLAECLYGK